jgi:predicted dithiol-disulfide oxidoreductase (DUF899 family)
MMVPTVVPEAQWQAALAEITEAEKRATRERDALAARRRQLPAVEIDKTYAFTGRDGPATLLDLFEGRHPSGSPQGPPYVWWRRHPEYTTQELHR